jgi:hypothetical protein
MILCSLIPYPNIPVANDGMVVAASSTPAQLTMTTIIAATTIG